MSDKQSLSFSYKSTGNLIHMITDVVFERSFHTSPRDISVYHQRYDAESDEFFQGILERLYPDGCTIGETEITAVVEFIRGLMSRDEKCKDLYVDWDKHHSSSWVYFKPEKHFEYADTGEHMMIVTNIMCDFFKGMDDNSLSVDYIKKFILENFEIRSQVTNLKILSNNTDYILSCIKFHLRSDE